MYYNLILTAVKFVETSIKFRRFFIDYW